ncbi:MAG: hypothetical protein QOG87_3463 [Actinomycetota bacterium]
MNGPDEPSEEDEELPVDRDLSELTADEVRRRTEAPLPRSLIEFLR